MGSMNDKRGETFDFDRPKYRKREMICLIVLGALFSFMSLAGVFYDVSDQEDTIV